MKQTNIFNTIKVTITLTLACLISAGCGKGGAGTEVFFKQDDPQVVVIRDEHTNSSPEPKIVSNFQHPEYPITNSTDGKPDTFMTTPALQMGAVRYISYRLDAPAFVSGVTLADNYSKKYSLGDLEIQVSSDSTDGINGAWETVALLSASNNNFVNGHGSANVNRSSVKWIKLKMTYTGTGAHGGTPSFYLSEISFH